jgi:hypothetical protein
MRPSFSPSVFIFSQCSGYPEAVMLWFGAGIAIGASFGFPVLLTATEAEYQTGFLLGVDRFHRSLLLTAFAVLL